MQNAASWLPARAHNSRQEYSTRKKSLDILAGHSYFCAKKQQLHHCSRRCLLIHFPRIHIAIARGIFPWPVGSRPDYSNAWMSLFSPMALREALVNAFCHRDYPGQVGQ